MFLRCACHAVCSDKIEPRGSGECPLIRVLAALAGGIHLEYCVRAALGDVKPAMLRTLNICERSWVCCPIPNKGLS